jgi:hypothetical protein
MRNLPPRRPAFSIANPTSGNDLYLTTMHLGVTFLGPRKLTRRTEEFFHRARRCIY